MTAAAPSAPERRRRPPFSPTAAPALAVALLALALAGCAGRFRPAPPEIAARAAAARSYSARLRVTLRGPDLRARTPVLIGFRRPDALRLEIPGPSGARLMAVARAGRLVAVFPGERAVFQGPAREAELEALLGVALTPAEIMDLLLGTPSPRLRRYRADWGAAVPRRLDAVLPDGSHLQASVEEAELDPDLPAAAFEEPPHAGYRAVDAAETRQLWGAR